MVEPKPQYPETSVDPNNLLSQDDDENCSDNNPVVNMLDADEGDKEDRMGFIKKVYAILSVQLTFTAMAIAATTLDPELNAWMSQQAGLAIGLFLFSIVIELVLICCRSFSRKVPTNYLLLLLFTSCQAFYFAMVTTMYDAESVLSSALMTAGMTVALTIYAFTTKTDFTVCGGLFFVMSIAMIFLVLISMFMTFAAWWYPLLSVLFVVMFSLYLIYDT